MAKINKSLFSSEKTDWETPDTLFNECKIKYNITLDVCATKNNTKCKFFFDIKKNGLIQDWKGICWMNPPYGTEIVKWVSKAYAESVINNNCGVVALLPARTDTRWFHNFIYKKENIKVIFLKGRLIFKGAKSTAPFPSALVLFNVDLIEAAQMSFVIEFMDSIKGDSILATVLRNIARNSIDGIDIKNFIISQCWDNPQLTIDIIGRKMWDLINE